MRLDIVTHACNPNTKEAEAGGIRNLRPSLATKLVQGQPALFESLLQKSKHQNPTGPKKKRETKKLEKMVFSLLAVQPKAC